MSAVTHFLSTLINRQIDEHGIVVWYDGEEHFRNFVGTFRPDNTTVIEAGDSLLATRREVEPLLEYVEDDGSIRIDCNVPPRLLLYVPRHRAETDHALIEAECAGIVLEPGAASLDQNTRLQVIAERVFQKVAPEKAEHIGRQVGDGLLSLSELDNMAGEVNQLASSGLKLIFGQAAPTEVALLFVSSDAFDKKLASKKAWGELRELLNKEFSYTEDEDSEGESLRADLRRSFLVTELAESTSMLPESLDAIRIDGSDAQRDLVCHACRIWRQRLDMREAYLEAAGAVAAELNLNPKDWPLSESSETFAEQDRLWITRCADLFEKKKYSEAREIASGRKQLFWSLNNPEIGLSWRFLEECADICERIGEAERLIQKQKPDLTGWLQAYTEFTQPLMIIENLLTSCRNIYARYVDSSARAFGSAYFTDLKDGSHLTEQRTTYAESVGPLVDSGKRIAYLLVDALRYEMAAELLNGLQSEFETHLSPIIGQTPGITQIGMAALMPGAESDFSLSLESKKVTPSIHETMVKDRETRLGLLTKKVGDGCLILKLAEVASAGRPLRKKIQEAKFLCVTSQEIDRLGESAEEGDDTRLYMASVLERLQAAIRRILASGFESIILTADHGFLHLQEADSGMKMDAPGGDTWLLHPRCWIGVGGKQVDGAWRMPFSHVGLGGEGEVVFPQGAAVLKAKGSSYGYMHGGISPQEVILPLAIISTTAGKNTQSNGGTVLLEMSKKEVTNRFFSLNLSLTGEELFRPESRRVAISITQGRKAVGYAAMAAYGFEESTRSILLEPDKPNAVTVMISPEAKNQSSIRIKVEDIQTGVVVAEVANVPLTLSI
jgi:hypothetical protein